MIGMQSCSLIMNFSPVTPGYCLRHRKFICLGEGGEGERGKRGEMVVRGKRGRGGKGRVRGERGRGGRGGERGEATVSINVRFKIHLPSQTHTCNSALKH